MFELEMAEKIRELEKQIQYLMTLEKGHLAAIGTWQTWIPSSVTGFSGTPTVICSYFITGKTFFFNIGAMGTSDSTLLWVELPTGISVKTLSGLTFIQPCFGRDNGVTTASSRWQADSGKTRIEYFKDMTGAAWTASGAKIVVSTGFFEIN